jgi:hypothetical protein
MRAAVAIALLAAPAAADPAATATTTLDDHAIAALAGCWKSHGERWTFRRHGDHGLEVIRDVGDASYAERARIPRDVLFDPKANTFGFGAAGRIHAELFVFVIRGDHLEAWPYWKPDGAKGYAWSGNEWTLVACRART